MSWEVTTMRSKTSFFNAELFRKTVSRFWPIWGGYLFIWLMTVPLSIGSRLTRCIRFSDVDGIMLATQSVPLQSAQGEGIIMTAVFALFMAMAVYGFMYSSRMAGGYCSLPLNRRCLFITLTAAGLIPMLAANVLVFAVTALVEAALGCVYMPALWGFLGVVSMETLFFFGFAALCAMLTGSIVVLPPLYAVLNVTFYVLESVVQGILKLFVYGYAGPEQLYLRFLSPAVEMAEGTRIISDSYATAEGVWHTSGYHMEGYIVFAIYAAVGAALLVGAYFLLKRRRMESAGDVVAVKPLRPVFKYCMAVGCALVLGLVLYSIVDVGVLSPTLCVAALLGFMLTGCFIGYFGSAMLLGKTFRVFDTKKSWLGFIITCATICSLTVACELDAFGYERRVPAEGEIASVHIICMGEEADVAAAENVAAAAELHRSIIENKDYHESPERNSAYNTRFAYHLADGSTLNRYYSLCLDLQETNGDLRMLQELMNTQEAINNRKATEYPIAVSNIDYANVQYAAPEKGENEFWQNLELTDEEAYELYSECILPDIADGALGRIWLIEDEEYINTVYNCTINIECNRRDEGEDGRYVYQSFYTVPTADSHRTNAWLAAHGVKLVTRAECGALPWYEYYSGVTQDYIEKYGYVPSDIYAAPTVDRPAAAAVEIID